MCIILLGVSPSNCDRWQMGFLKSDRWQSDRLIKWQSDRMAIGQVTEWHILLYNPFLWEGWSMQKVGIKNKQFTILFWDFFSIFPFCFAETLQKVTGWFLSVTDRSLTVTDVTDSPSGETPICPPAFSCPCKYLYIVAVLYCHTK